MAATRSAGGPFGRGGYRLTWQGATIARQIDAAMQKALDDTGTAAVARARSIVPVDTGRLRDSISSEVSAAGGKRTLVLAADQPYALYVETGTSRMAAQPFLRPAIDAEAPKLTARLKAAVGGR